MKMLIVGVSLFFVAGCETAGSIAEAKSNGVAAMFSCEQVKSMFSAYDRDKSSWAQLNEIAKISGYDVSNMDITKNAASYYESVKNSTNLALMLKGCEPI
ncbi:MAG: hypothetical protein ACJA0N_000896 [Pseudohongiellaceae bacterium]|jgi:hypothetical protein